MAFLRGYLRDLVRPYIYLPNSPGLTCHPGDTEKGVEQNILVDNLSPAEITTKFSKLLSL